MTTEALDNSRIQRIYTYMLTMLTTLAIETILIKSNFINTISPAGLIDSQITMAKYPLMAKLSKKFVACNLSIETSTRQTWIEKLSGHTEKFSFVISLKLLDYLKKKSFNLFKSMSEYLFVKFVLYMNFYYQLTNPQSFYSDRRR